jgi:hypothetical protein
MNKDKQGIILLCIVGVMGMLVALGIGEHILGRHTDLLSPEMIQHDLVKLKQLAFDVSFYGLLTLVLLLWALYAIKEEE